MSPEYYQTEQMRSDNSSVAWGNSGMSTPTGCWTLSISECHSDADVSLLSQVLDHSTPERYCLSPKACAGILRRAEKRGKELPPILNQALVGIVKDAEPCEPLAETLEEEARA